MTLAQLQTVEHFVLLTMVTQDLSCLDIAFFDANATGNLEFLKSIVEVNKEIIYEKGMFFNWQLN